LPAGLNRNFSFLVRASTSYKRPSLSVCVCVCVCVCLSVCVSATLMLYIAESKRLSGSCPLGTL